MLIANVKSILIGFAQDEQRLSSALAYGLALAAHARAHVTIQALSLRVNAPYSPIGDIASTLAAAENKRRHATAEAVVEKARQDALALGVPCTADAPQLPYDELTFAFATWARVHDFTVLDADSELLSLTEGVLHQALFESGRPVIVVPRTADRFACKRMLVAWDGSAKAARAVNDALPFLRAADGVEIVSVAGEKDLSRSIPGADLAPQLERHGVEVVVKNMVAQDGDVAEALRQEAHAFGADMIVMGAFVHSRLRELMFGGVTRSMLGQSSIPLFLSH
ncbi:MAG TPA: universal stress protein [Beijerinckiaceae bacterium]